MALNSPEACLENFKKSMEYKLPCLGMKETDNVAEVFKALSVTDENIVEGKPLLFTTRDEMMKKFKNVKNRQDGSSIFTIFWVQGQNGETLIFLHDSGCSEACILIKAVGTAIPAAEITQRNVEVAGGTIISQQSCKLLFPLAEGLENYLEVNSICMEKILNEIPGIDISDVLQKIVYPNYLKSRHQEGKEPEFKLDQIPSKTVV